jgi:hypothetical protein
MVGVLAAKTAAAVHPQDGPHADIRIAIDESGISMGLMINLAFIDEAMPFIRESVDAVHEVEEAGLREVLVAHFSERHKMWIDGVEVAPVVGAFEMIRPGVENLPLFPRSGMRGLLRARLDLTYPAKSQPRSVRIRWEGYPPNILAEVAPGEAPPPLVIEAQLSAEGRVDILEFTTTEPERTWHGTGLTREQRFESVPELTRPAPTQVPILAIGLGGVGLLSLALAVGLKAQRPMLVWCAVLSLAAMPFIGSRGSLTLESESGLIEEREAIAIFAPLHGNIYRAFDYESQSEIYDALARSVDGDLLESLYDQIYRSLIMYEEGGAVSRVSAVRLLESEMIASGTAASDEPAFTVLARWQVDGVVYHAGHSHRRTNEYLAELVVAHREAGWRIVAHRMIEQNRLEPHIPAETPTPAPVRPDGEI